MNNSVRVRDKENVDKGKYVHTYSNIIDEMNFGTLNLSFNDIGSTFATLVLIEEQDKSAGIHLKRMKFEDTILHLIVMGSYLKCF